MIDHLTEKLKYGPSKRGNVLLRIPNQIRRCGQQSGYLKLGGASRSRLRERLVEFHSTVRHQADPSCQIELLPHSKVWIVVETPY